MTPDILRNMIWEWLRVQDADSCLVKAVFGPNYIVDYRGQMDIGMLSRYILERWSK